MIQTYVGFIKVSSTATGSSKETLYSNVKHFYGETRGKMFDNMVAASMSVANEAFTWVQENKPSDYSLGDNSWSLSIHHPRILPSPMGHLELDEGSSVSIDSYRQIVRTAALQRSLRIENALDDLRNHITVSSKLPLKPERSFFDVIGAKSFQDLARCGFTGDELEEILRISEEEGIMKTYCSRMGVLDPPKKKKRIGLRVKSKK